MKKQLSFLLTLLLVQASLTGCSSTNGVNQTVDSVKADVESPPPSLTDVLPKIPTPEPATAADYPPINLPLTEELIIYLPNPITMLPAVDLYREMYPHVNVIAEDLTGGGRYAYSARLNTELMAGTGPDILFPFYMYEADEYKMAELGTFTDLNSIIEQDLSFTTENYIKPVFDGGVYNNRRYIVPYSYQAKLYLSVPNMLDEIGFDLSQTGDTLAFFNEVTRTMPKAQENPKFLSMFGWPTYGHALFFSGIRFMDYESNVVLPDEAFIKKFYDAYVPYSAVDFNAISPELWEAKHLTNGLVMFADVPGILQFVALSMSLKAESDYQLHMMPGVDGKNHAYSFDTAAIRSNSPNQLNAWNFIKVLLSAEYQTHGHLSGIPVHKGAIAAGVEKHVKFYETNGETLLGSFEKLTKEEQAEYIETITNIHTCDVYNSLTLATKVSEYMRPYLSGENNFEACIQGLKNYLTIYYSE